MPRLRRRESSPAAPVNRWRQPRPPRPGTARAPPQRRTRQTSRAASPPHETLQDMVQQLHQLNAANEALRQDNADLRMELSTLRSAHTASAAPRAETPTGTVPLSSDTSVFRGSPPAVADGEHPAATISQTHPPAAVTSHDPATVAAARPVHELSTDIAEAVHIQKVEKLQVFSVDVRVREQEGQETASDTNVTSSGINIERCRDVKMEAHSITINMGHQLAELQVITDTNIKEAVTEALVAKVTWDGDRERELRELSELHTEEMKRVAGELKEARRRGEAALEEARRVEERARHMTQTLKTQLSEAEVRGRKGKKDRKKLEQRVQQMREEQRAAEERVATLRGKLRQEKTKGDKRLAAITRRYEEEKKRVEEQVMTFVIQVEEVHRQLLERRHLDEQRLSDVIQRLLSQFNIRLLGTDCGLRFLLDAPVSQWVKVVEKQLEIQAVLSDLIPEDARQDVTWTEVTQYGPSAEDIDLRIGQPLSLPDTSAWQSDLATEMPSAEHTVGNEGVEPHPPDRVMAFDPLTATPRRTFRMDKWKPMIQGDKWWPWITSLVVTDGGKIVMTDGNNHKVKVMDSRTRTIVSSLSLGVGPWGLALLHDKLVAVTPLSDDVIHLIDVTVTVTRRLQKQVEKVELRVVRQIKTVRKYQGVGCGGENGTLVVSCSKQGELPASVDILSRNGQVLKTVVIGEKLRGLCDPVYVCVVRGVALVSDCLAHCIYRVDLATGQLMSPITHDQLKSPHQLSADRSGNLYIASHGGSCVLVMGVDGRWRTLLRGEEHGEWGHVWPVSVTVTDTGVVVGWSGVGSVVTGFDLT